MQDSSASLIQSETFFLVGSALPASVQPLGIHSRDRLGNEWARKGNRVEGCFSRSLHEKTNFLITPEEVML